MNFTIGLMAMLTFGCASASENAPLAAASEATGILLVGNKGENTLSFIDLSTGRELDRRPTGPMPHEIAISPDGRQAAVVAYGHHSIDIFDIASREKTRTIDLSPNQRPHGLIWWPDGRLIATTEGSQSISVVDTRNGDAVLSIPTGQQGTHMVAITPDGRRAFTSNIGSGTVTVADLSEGRKLRDLAVGGRPEAIALSIDGRTLWVGDLEGARVQVFDTNNDERLAEIRTGQVPIRIVPSPDGRWMVTSNFGSGDLTVIDAQTREAVRTIPVSGAQDSRQVTILFSSDGERLYVAETGLDKIAEIDLESGRVLRRIDAGRNGDGLAIAPLP